MSEFTKPKFNGQIEDYAEFLEAVHRKLREHELLWTIDDRKYPNPLLPNSTVARLTGQAIGGQIDPPTNEDISANDKFQKQRRYYDTQADKALNIVVSMLGANPSNRTDAIRTNLTLTPRRILKEVMKELKDSYGTYTANNELRLRTKAYALPNAYTMEDVESTAYALIKINKEITTLRAASAMSDAELKAHLNSKNNCPQLEALFDKINDDDNIAWTFTEVLTKLKAKITQRNNCMPSTSHNHQSIISPQPNEGLTFATFQQHHRKQDFTTDLGPSNRIPKMINCHNCHQDGHGLRDCKVPMCRNCNKIFSSIHEDKYHTMDKCPQPRQKVEPRTFGKRKFVDNPIRQTFNENKRTNYGSEYTNENEDQFDDPFCNNVYALSEGGTIKQNNEEQDDEFITWARAQTFMNNHLASAQDKQSD